VEHINWQFGAVVDLSAAWALGQYCDILTQSTQGWAWALPANWAALTVDANLDVYTLGYSFDLKELQDAIVDGGVYDCMFKVYSKTLAKGLLNKPFGIVVVQGGMHGLSSERDADSGKVYRREAGSGAAWDLRSDSIASDGHAYWWWGDDLIHHYTGVVPTYWEYCVNAPDGADIARLYERQWERAWLTIRIGQSNLAITRHFSGTLLVTDVQLTSPNSVGEHKIQRGLGWSQRFVVPNSVDTLWANILTTFSRTELIEGKGNIQTRFARSLDGDWQTEQILEADYTCPFGVEASSRFYISAYKDGKQHLFRRERYGLHETVSDPIEIAASDEVAACLAYIDTQYRLLCAVQDDSAIKVYQSLNQGQTWALRQTLANLECPYIYAETERIWVLGYVADEIRVAAYYSHSEAIPEALALASVGQSDRGRGAIIRKPDTYEVVALAPKTNDWGLDEPTPAIAEYISADTGQTWTRKAIHAVT